MALISSSASVQNMEQAVMQSASNGTLLGYALCQTDVCVENVTLSFSPADDQIQVAVIRCLSSALRRSEPALFEPIVDMELHCSNSHIGDVISDLSRRRRAQINEVLPVAAERTRASAQVPLSEMIGYATAVRSLSQGSAHYSTRFRTFRQVPAREQAIILSKMFSPPSP
uniref:Elongation factor EFG domain-containing protein n=1 Tax=Spongospora subterranea TaxID=70186 RepID=A0A0H5QML7_9EUKA|eukprot:CRZ02641.1 hypothetical protein [Spongospora subterranea]